MTTHYGLRTLPTYPFATTRRVNPVGTEAECAELRRALPNGEHFEIVPLDAQGAPVGDEQGADVGLDPEAANGAQNGGKR